MEVRKCQKSRYIYFLTGFWWCTTCKFLHSYRPKTWDQIIQILEQRRGSTSCQKGEVALIFNVRHNSSSSRKNPFGSIINPLFTRFVRQRWLEISFIHQIGNYYCYMYCKTIKKNRMKEIQTYIRVCNVEFTKGLSYYRIRQGRFHLQCVSVKSVRIVQQLNQ